MDKEDEQLLLARLDEELEVGVDAATAEYYVDMAFDERLMSLLENEPSVTTINVPRITSQPLNSALFTPNDSESPEAIPEKIDEHTPIDQFSFRISGSLQTDVSTLRINAKIESDLHDQEPVIVENATDIPDTFLLYKATSDGFISQRITKEELLFFLASLSNIDVFDVVSALSAFSEEDRQKPQFTNGFIEQLWAQLGEEAGSKRTERTIEHDISDDPASPRKKVLKLTYVQEETATESLVHLSLAHVETHEDLDVSDTHRLQLMYSFDTRDTFAHYAERFIVSGMPSMKLIKIEGTHHHSGRTIPLNLYDPEIIELFVNWFDELVSA